MYLYVEHPTGVILSSVADNKIWKDQSSLFPFTVHTAKTCEGLLPNYF